MTPFLAMWRPDPRDGSRFDRVVLVLELLEAKAPHSPHVRDGARVRLWRSSLGRFTGGCAVVRAGELILTLDKRDARIERARAALEAEGIEVAA
jgi:hypothetical protein